MNICIISSAFPSNRNQIINIFVYKQAKSLVERRHNIFVVAGDTESRVEGGLVVYARPGPIKSALLALKAMFKIPKESFWLLKNIGLKGTVGRLSLVQITCNLLKREKIDVIDGHWGDYGAVIAYLVSKICGRKYIATCHGSDVACGENGVPDVLPKGRREIVSVALENADCVVVDSQSIASDVIKYCSKNPIIVHHGVDLSLFKPGDKKIFERKTVISVGSLTKRKGYEYLLKAIKKVLEKNRDVDFLIVGNGPEEANFKTLAAELNITYNVTFKDFVPDEELPRYLLKK